MESILIRYADLPGNHDLVFRSLCSLLSMDPEGADWAEFSLDDWDLFRSMAVDEDVAEMAYYTLRTKPPGNSNPNFDSRCLTALGEREAITTIRNTLLFKQLDRIIASLADQEIPVVLLKGADLAYTIYPEIGLRPMTDLDLLVPQASFEKALAVVNELGYQAYLPEASPGLDKLLSHHAHLRKGTHGPLLELHWTLVGTPAFRHAVAMDWFWENQDILRQAADLGALSVRFTGGEPLLRNDSTSIYLFARPALRSLLSVALSSVRAPQFYRAGLFLPLDVFSL